MNADPGPIDLLKTLRVLPSSICFVSAGRRFEFLTRRFVVAMLLDERRDPSHADVATLESSDAIAAMSQHFNIDMEEVYDRAMAGLPANVHVPPRTRLGIEAPVPAATLQVRPVFGDDDNSVGFIATLVDREPTIAATDDQNPLAALETIPVGVWEYDSNLVQSRVTDRWLSQVGYTRDDVGDLTMAEFWTSIMHPDDLDRVLVLDARRQATVVEYRLRRPDGSYKWMRSHALNLSLNHDGTPGLIRGVIYDVDDERRSRIELETALDRTYRMLDSTEEGLLLTNLQGVVTAVNAEAARLIGRLAEDIVGRRIEDLVVLRDDKGDLLPDDVFVSQMSSGEGVFPEVAMSRPDGTSHRVTISYGPIGSERGGFNGTIIKIRDVIRHLGHLAERDRNERLRALGQLASGIAHDFNNLLNTISGAAELVERDHQLSQRSIDCIGLITSACTQAAELTSKLLTFNPEPTRVLEPVDLNRAVRDVAKILQFAIDKRSRVRLELDANTLAVEGSKEAIETALLNLGINAHQAMPHGGDIVIRTSSRTLSALDCDAQPFDLMPGTYFAISVSDNGVGIAPDDLGRVFEPFFSRRIGGTGLGLAAVYGTVVEHGGSIQVRSKQGVGTEVEMLLPALDPSRSVEAPVPHKLFDNTRRRPFAGLQALAADGGARVLEIVKILLEDLGFNVLTANDGSRAVDTFFDHADQIDVVILDLGMPELDGEEVLRRLQERRPGVPVIVVSGYVPPAREATLIDLGARAVLPKPYRITELEDLITACLKLD